MIVNAEGSGGANRPSQTSTPAPTSVPGLVTDSTTAPSTAPVPLGVPAPESWIVTARPELPEVQILSAPNGEPLTADQSGTGTASPVILENPTAANAPLTFLARQRGVSSQGSMWHEVYLPTRPNGSTGWVADAQVTISSTDLAAVVRLDDRSLTLYRAGKEIVRYPVATGAPDTPTPTGRFAVKELAAPDAATDPQGTYGPLAYGLTAHSEVPVDTGAFPDGVIGIHGTNQPELIGQSVSSGCIRLSNPNILQLQALGVPLGMPVDIVDGT